MSTIVPSSQAGVSVAYTGTAGNTGNLASAEQVLIWTTTDAYIKVGEDVVATSGDTPIPAFTPLVFAVPETPFRVSAIQISAGGTVYAKAIKLT